MADVFAEHVNAQNVLATMGRKQAAYNALFVDELRVTEVIDPAVLSSYEQMITKNMQAFTGDTSTTATHRLNDVDVRRRVIQAVLNSVD